MNTGMIYFLTEQTKLLQPVAKHVWYFGEYPELVLIERGYEVVRYQPVRDVSRS